LNPPAAADAAAADAAAFDITVQRIKAGDVLHASKTLQQQVFSKQAF
jgi:hypothetical protein